MIDLRDKFKNRLDQDYVPLLLKNDLKFLVEGREIDVNYFMGHERNFYNTIVQYLEKYAEQYSDFRIFDWTKLNKKILWNEAQDSFKYFSENKNVNI